MNKLGLIRRETLLNELQIPNSTLYRWMNEGRFPKPVKKVSRIVFWKVSDVEDWVSYSQTEEGKMK